MNKIAKVLVLLLVAIMLFGTVYSSASEPYDTYTYSIDGDPQRSPAAYTAMNDFDARDMNLSAFGNPLLSQVKDIATDNDANVYISDSGNNRIIVLNKYYEAVAVISEYVDENGKLQKLSDPQGIFVTDPDVTATGESYVYVCDTGNLRVVVFDRDYNYVRTINKPDSNVLEEGAFKPNSIAVDLYGRIFIVSTSAYEGVIVLSGEGDFTGFIGAQKVSMSLIQRLWRRFMSAEQRASQVQNLATAYNNIAVDKDGFVYVTNQPTDTAKTLDALESKTATASPVKKLNSQGTEIMKRNGFFDPSGEVVYDETSLSTIIDIGMGEEGAWTILDSSRSRFFTYDQNGNLLFAFGDSGDQLGNGESFVGMTYQVVDGEYRILALDNAQNGFKVTVYVPTDYYGTIISALRNQNNHNYSESILYWQDVLTQNNNLDLAYIGIGKALYNQGKYVEAQEMFAHSFETDNYSVAFKELRKEVIGKWILPMIVLIIVLVVLLMKFLGYAKKKNKAVSLKVGRKTYWEELIYAFHLVFHPFDGFWDLKHEKRGSVRAASTIVGLTILAFFYQAIGRGYTFNPRATFTNIILQVLAIGIPVILWCVANWCLTTLFDGEGSFKDIYVATGYALAPLPPFVVLSTILTNILTVDEGAFVTLLISLATVWMVFLLFFGTLVTQDYSLAKNFVTILGTIVAMAVIMFVATLFSSLIAKMVSFIISLISEIGNRI